MSSGAQSWSVKGIDPKIREAAREAAARQGMSLGEFLSHALQQHAGVDPAASTGGPPPRPHGLSPHTPPPSAANTRLRSPRLSTPPTFEDEEDDWQPSAASGYTTRVSDPVRLAQRIDSIERRTQLAVTGLDRAVSTIDRSVLGLAARIEDAETLSGESADRIAEALEHFRIAGDTLGGRLEQAEDEVQKSREALERANADLTDTRERLTHQVSTAQLDLNVAKERLENQVALAEEVARRAEAAANFLSTELENRDAALTHKIGAAEDRTREAISQTLSQARAAAEEAARQASEASADAVLELRSLHDRLADRVEESETGTRSAIERAIEQTRAEQHTINQRVAGVEFEARGVKESLVEEVVRLESEIGTRIAAADQLKAEQHALIQRIEKAESGARESTAGLRQAAGAAIADLRNAQLTLAARLKQVEDAAGRTGTLDLAEMRAHQAEIAERLAGLEDKTRHNPMQDALTAFEKRLDDITLKVGQGTGVSDEKIERVDGAVKTIDEAMKRLAERIAETESSANTAIRALEQTVSELGARVEGNVAGTQETEQLRAMLEQRLDTMVGQARQELEGQVHAALLGSATEEGFEDALADVNRRLAAAERRQAQTIEAISIEIKRMSETVDRRLRTVESRNDDAAASTVREELTRMGKTLEARFDEIERREAAAFDRMGLEVGRLSERLEERVGTVESRSAQAIEHVGEQVARMAERFNQRHEILARDLGERMLDSEERAGARVADAIGSIMQRLQEVETHSTEAVAPVQKAMSSMASRLEALNQATNDDTHDDLHDEVLPTPTRRFEDFVASDTYSSPMEAAQPTRAAPLTPTAATPPIPAPTAAFAAPQAPSPADADSDIYFADDIDLIEDEAPIIAEPRFDPTQTRITPAPAAHTPAQPATPPLDLAVDDPLGDDPFLDDADAFAPPPEDDDPFWTPDTASTVLTAATPAAPTATPAATATPEEPKGKNDYLNAARKAAQAQNADNKKKGKTKEAPAAQAATTTAVAATPTLSLRGSSRIVLWGAASAIALLVAGGAWYLNAQDEARNQTPAPTPEPATQQTAPPVTDTIDPNTPPVDPFATPPEGSAPADPTATPPASEAQTAPTIAQATPPVAATPATPTRATPQRAAPRQQTTAQVAAPLPPRNVSLEQAANNGDAVAQYELALQRISAGRPNEAVVMLHQAADRGLAMAQYRLAKLYERGQGVQQDLTMARQWTERAAAAGNRRAMHDLGVYFARGEGATLDEAAAFRWFRQAAELGVADSQYNLGVLYQQGRGVGASATEAMFWFLVAARQGDSDAASRASALEAQLQPIQVEQARARADAFRPRAASAVANGEFGPRPWTSTTTAQATRPRG